MKNIVMILILMLGLSRVTAQVTETGGGNIQQALNTVFQNVDMAQVPTGLLMSKSIYFTNIHDYDGTTLSDSTNLNINTLGWLYAMLNMSKIGTNTFPTPESLYGENSYTGAAVPLVLLCERYNYIKSTAFDQNLLNYTNGQLYEVGGTHKSPYAEDTLFAVSPVVNYFKTGNISFVLPSSRIVQNVGTVESFALDFGTGNGLQAFDVDEVVNVSLPSGIHHVYVQISTRKGRVVRRLKCRFDIEVAQTQLTPESGGPDDVYAKNNSKTNPVAVPNPNGPGIIAAEVTTFYACLDKKLRKPLLILDGFNSGSKNNADDDNIDLDKFLDFFNTYRNTPVSTASTPRFITQDLRKEGYDLIFVNWKSEGGRADLRDNSLLLQEILKRVNEEKAPFSTEKNVIIGISMGGVIAKHAILNSEFRNPTAENGGHDVRLLIGYDSPMQGANISLGFQYLVKDFGEDMLLGLGGFLPKLKKGLTTLKSPAARQLLTYQAFGSDPRAPNTFRNFFNELNAMGKPQKCDYKTVSNGSMIGTPNFPAGKRLMGDGFYSISQFIPTTVGFGTFISVDVRALPLTSANNALIYERKITAYVRILGTTISRNLLPPKRKEVANMRPLDGCPGGTTDVTGDIKVPFITDLGFGSIRGDRYDDGNREIIQTTFIPVVSALDIQTTDVFLNVLTQLSLVTSGFVGSRSNPQFDAAQFIGVTVGENRISNQVHAGLSYRTTGFLLYELITKNALQTSGNVTLNNRTYNFGTSSYPYPTNLPQSSGFDPKGTTNIIDYTLNVENTGQLWVNRSGKVGFTDDVNNPTNATNSAYSLIIRQGESCKSSTDNALGIVNVRNSGLMRVGDGSTNNPTNVKILKGGTLKIQNAGSLTTERAGTFITVENGGQLIVEAGGNLNLTGIGNKIIVKTGGKMVIDGGANINLTGLTSSVLIEQGGELVINGTMNYSGVGYFQFDIQHILTLNSDLVLRGSGLRPLIKLTDAPFGTVNKLTISGRSVDISDAAIWYGTNSQIEITNSAASQINSFVNVSFQGNNNTSTAVNILNASSTSAMFCGFDNLLKGIALAGNGTNSEGIFLAGCRFSNVNNGFLAKDVQAVRLAGCSFTYDASPIMSGIGSACRFENIPLVAFESPSEFSGDFFSTNSWKNYKAIELVNSTMYTESGLKIFDFDIGIDASVGINHIGLLDNTEINHCNIGIYASNGDANHYLDLHCARIINNMTGIKGSNTHFGGNGKTISYGNEFKNSSDPNSLLFDIFYYIGVFGNPLGEGNISANNSYWSEPGGFEVTKFKILRGKCPTCNDTNGGPTTRREIEQFAEANAWCAGNWVQSGCGLFLFASDGLNSVTGQTVNCATSGGSRSDALISQKPNNPSATKADNDKLSIYPNPATETVKLDIESGNYALKVSNTVGQTIFTQNTEGSLSVNVATWTNGIYLFEVTNKATNQSKRSKIVVQH